MGNIFGLMNTAGAVFATVLAFVSAQPRAAVASGGVESRMFELTYANASDVAENLNRTWCGQVQTNGNCVVGEMSVAFAEAMRDE